MARPPLRLWLSILLIVLAMGMTTASAIDEVVDDYENEDLINGTLNVARNSTIDGMQLDNSSYLQWDFDVVDWTEQGETFPAGWTTATAGAGTITRDATHVVNGSWAIKIYTPDVADQAFAWDAMVEQAGDYHLRYYIYPDGADEPDNCYVLLTHDNGATTNLISILDFQGGVFYLQNQDADSTDNVGALTPDAWNKVDVHWNDATNKFNYSIDDIHMGLFDDFTDSNPDQVYIGDTSAGAQSGIYWLDALAIGDASLASFGSYAPFGTFNTTNYLDALNYNATVLLTNTSISLGSINAEISADGSTWTDLGALDDGYTAIDLRALGLVDTILRFNMSRGPVTDTPVLYQVRLVHEGPGAGGPSPPQNVTGTWEYYNLTAIDVIVGTHDSGDLNSTLDHGDGDTFNVSEVVGVPGFIVSFNGTVDPDAGCLWVVINAWYDGNQAHDIDIELYNHTSLAWVDLGHILDGVAFEWFNVTVYGLRIPMDFVNGAGEVWGRLNHVSAGNINHDIYIDYLKIHAFIPSDVTPTVSGTVATDVTPFIAIGLILALSMYLLADRLRK